ncbi:MAG: SDR family NAD(P)-dependent oxidoreductase [Oscillospiraceae bacterium]
MNIDYIKSIFSLDGRKAVVTGASSGIGRAIAVSLANFGAEVALLGRSAEKLRETREIIEKSGGVCQEYIVDISDTASQDRFFDEFMKKNGRLDIFIANAGINKRAELPDTDLADIEDMIKTDYYGTLYGMIKASNIMKPQRSGNMVVITSINALSPLPNQAVYSSVKAALESAMQSFAGSMAEYGVRVNSCAPGCIHTPLNRHIFGVDEYREEKEKNIPLGKIGHPEDIGDVVATMVSDAYRYMTGSTILVDGGELMRKKQKQPAIDTPVL